MARRRYVRLRGGQRRRDGRGSPNFGQFCLVTSDPASWADKIAVFPSDSAERHCSPAGVIDEHRARGEATSWACRGQLATIERAAEARTTLQPAWPWLICNAAQYLEVVLTPGPPLGYVRAVRLRNEHLAHLEDLKLADVDDDMGPSAEQRELIAFEALNRWRTEHDVEIEGVG